MRKISLHLNKFSNKHFLLIWLIFHIAILTYFASSFIAHRGNISIDADLFNIFPDPTTNEAIRKADDSLLEATAQNIYILVSHKDFDTAKKTAESVYTQLNGSDNFKTLSLYTNFSSVEDIYDYLYKYRYNLLDDETINKINADGGESFAMNALATAYSGFTLLPLDDLDSDPFMLSEHNLNTYLNLVQSTGTSMSLKDNVLASEKDGVWYIMLTGILSKKGAALANKNNGVQEIYDVCLPLENDETKFVFSGTPFSSHQNSNSANKEITIISTVSILIVIILLFTVFGSPIPILFSLLSILLSIVSAILMTMGFFHKLHILTLVFGTSLIGSCIDYSIHFFTHWAGNKKLNSGDEIRKHLLPGLTLAIVSSVLCYAILMFAPFNLLKQMSLFSLTGLTSSFLTTIGLFPYIKMPQGERKIKVSAIIKNSNHPTAKKWVGRAVITSFFVISIGSILIFHKRLTIENDVNKLYKDKGRLAIDLPKAYEILNYDPTTWLIVSGETPEDVFQLEERMRNKIDHDEHKNPYISPTIFIPSIEHQKKSRAACLKLLSRSEEQLEYLGFDPADSKKILSDFYSKQNDFITIDDPAIPEVVMSLISITWLGQINGTYYSVILPNNSDNASFYKELEKESPNLHFTNKLYDMSRDLDKLTILELKFFSIAYIIIFIILKLFYKLKQALKIISIPLLIVLITTAVYVIFNIKLEFFTTTGLILVFGLGLDYIIYMMENEQHKGSNTSTLEPFAIMLSFITTIISFGALSLSSFPPVHLMGLSIFLGLTTSYTSTMFYDRSL